MSAKPKTDETGDCPNARALLSKLSNGQLGNDEEALALLKAAVVEIFVNEIDNSCSSPAIIRHAASFIGQKHIDKAYLKTISDTIGVFCQ